jgi:aminopeptidase N
MIKKRHDYQPSTFVCPKVYLELNLSKQSTEVYARLHIAYNHAALPPGSYQNNVHAIFDCKADAPESGQLLEIKLNGRALTDFEYAVSDNSLTVFHVPSEFILETRRQLTPALNKSLEGLYASQSGLFTQCEAEGFRKITYMFDRPDVLSVYDVVLKADAELYPVLLSNGNKVSEKTERVKNPQGQEYTQKIVHWHDPWPKPCYLFAVVAADLKVNQSQFHTSSGKKVELNVWVHEKDLDQTDHCMKSLMKSMEWDEKRFGREYDLDVFNLVAVSDFNMGAMENKGLNIFNTKYVLAKPETATDVDYAGIEGVVGHEYFHNWSGNRVTCRDWFQLSLKEGFTVFRDQEFSSDVGSRAIKRIEDVRRLKQSQFPEDAGPTAHPVRPDQYEEISNFYTTTIYEKGAEVVRMLQTILGEEKFRKGCDVYFQRFDGQAVTCDDFVQCMEEVSGIDLTQFKRWYSQAGTPELCIKTEYKQDEEALYVYAEQKTPPTPGQENKEPVVIPVRLGLIGNEGKPLNIWIDGDDKKLETTQIMMQSCETWVFKNISTSNVDKITKPIVSLLRGFSAPVTLKNDINAQALRMLLAYDADPYNQYAAAQELYTRMIIAAYDQNVSTIEWTNDTTQALRTVLLNPQLDKNLVAYLLTLPSLQALGDAVEEVDYDRLHALREKYASTHCPRTCK